MNLANADMSIALPGELFSTDDELLAQDAEYLELVDAKKAEAVNHQMENSDDNFCF